MKHRKRWSSEEVSFLRNNWTQLTDEQIGEELNRTGKSVKEKRHGMKFTPPRGHHLIRWTQNDTDRMVRMILDGRTNEDIAEELGYSESTVTLHAQAYRIGAGQAAFRGMDMRRAFPEWSVGEGVQVRTPHELLEGVHGPLAKLEVLNRRRDEIIEVMTRHSQNCHHRDRHNTHEKEFKRVRQAYREVRLAIDAIDRGAWTSDDGV